MGNNPSKQPSGAGTVQHASSPVTHRKEQHRRQSIQPLAGGGKATAADPSESITSATAQAISQPSSQQQQHGLHQHLRTSDSPDLNARNIQRLEAGHSRASSKSSARDVEFRSKGNASPEPSGPVKVPNSDRAKQDHNSRLEPSAPPSSAYYGVISRPPRLPLPIEKEDYQPGSPIFAPANLNDGDIDIDALEDTLPSKTSMLSSTTVDDDEIGEELPNNVEGISKTVPTLIEWKGSGDKVYVTGTFASWNKKFRLHRNSHDGYLSAILQLPPGTHHLKFIVDGDMRNSDELPTAVDYTNVLVNYIEVSADDIPKQSPEEKLKSEVPPGVYPPQVLPETVEKDFVPVAKEPSTAEEDEDDDDTYRQKFNSIVPQFLVDVDREEESADYQRAANIIGDTPHPPSLPLFLGKSILNGQTPMKDDGSVLNYPNHTVLNHLATSSIKNGVLATSVTTRYKRKYVTTIMYKPTFEAD